MFIYIPDWHMFYELDAFRYDKESKEVSLLICGYRIEIVLKYIDYTKWRRVRSAILRDVYLEVSAREFEWDMKLLNCSFSSRLCE